MKKIIISVFLLFFLLGASSVRAGSDPATRLKGYVLLQVETHGEAWYVNPDDLKKYYLGRPSDAFNLMRRFGLGINETDFKKLQSDSAFREKYLGKIFIEVENNGEAWYLNPSDQKLYYLGRPSDAFTIMKNFGLGITNQNLNQIDTGSLISVSPVSDNNSDVFYSAASAIIIGNNNVALSYFTPDAQNSVNYTLNFLDAQGKFTLGNIMAGAKLMTSTDTEKIYSTTVSVGSYSATIYFHVKKQSDGKWLVANL